MANISSDKLRDISVAVVEDFVNNKTPLSQGLAKQAAAYDLNSEQVQRCVEASNTIAHLKLLSVAEDRTFEFPLCKFAEVMQHAAIPDFEKSAGLWSGVKNTIKDAVGKGEIGKKLRQAKDNVDVSHWNLKETAKLSGQPGRSHTEHAAEHAHYKKVLDEDKDVLKEVTGLEQHVRHKAGLKVTGAVAGTAAAGTGAYVGAKHLANKRDASGMSKQAAYEEYVAPMLSENDQKLFFIKAAAANKQAIESLESRSVTLLADLTKAAGLVAKDTYGLDKIACVVDAEIAPQVTALVYGQPTALRDFGAARDGLFKAAELKHVEGLSELYKEATAVLQELKDRKALQKRAELVQAGLQKEAFVAALGRAVGSGFGHAAGAPVRAAKLAVGGITSASKAATGKKGVGAALATGGALAGAGFDASLYSPPTSSVTGKSKDVWKSLQAK